EVVYAAGVGPAEPQPGVLHRVVGLAQRAQHAVGDRPQVRPVRLELLGQKLALVHRSHLLVGIRQGADGPNRSNVTRSKHMARIPGVSPAEAGQEVATTLDYVRHGLAEMTGSAPERGIEPLEIVAHVPALLRGVLAHNQAAAEANRVPTPTKHLAHLKPATITN